MLFVDGRSVGWSIGWLFCSDSFLCHSLSARAAYMPDQPHCLSLVQECKNSSCHRLAHVAQPFDGALSHGAPGTRTPTSSAPSLTVGVCHGSGAGVESFGWPSVGLLA